MERVLAHFSAWGLCGAADAQHLVDSNQNLDITKHTGNGIGLGLVANFLGGDHVKLRPPNVALQTLQNSVEATGYRTRCHTVNC